MKECTIKMNPLAIALAFAAAASVALLLSAGAFVQSAHADLIVWDNPKELSSYVKNCCKRIDMGTRKRDTFVFVSNKPITNVKSSNAKVIFARSGAWNGGNHKGCYQLKIVAKNSGKATLKYTIGGKAFTLKSKVYKYTRPVKKLAVGKVNYTSKFKKKIRCQAKGALAGKVVIKPVKGWKVRKISWTDEDYNDHRIKSGDVLPEGAIELVVTMKNKKTKQSYVLTVSA